MAGTRSPSAGFLFIDSRPQEVRTDRLVDPVLMLKVVVARALVALCGRAGFELQVSGQRWDKADMCKPI